MQAVERYNSVAKPLRLKMTQLTYAVIRSIRDRGACGHLVGFHCFILAIFCTYRLQIQKSILPSTRVFKMSLTVTAVFVGCVFPASLTIVLRPFRLVSQTVRAFGLLLLFLSSVVNPFMHFTVLITGVVLKHC